MSDKEHLLSRFEMDPAEFYAQVISPYKGELELWYQDHLSFLTDLQLIFLNAWAVVFPKTELLTTRFPDLPEKPNSLIQG